MKYSSSDSGQLFTREGYIRGGGFFCRYLVPPAPASPYDDPVQRGLGPNGPPARCGLRHGLPKK